MTTLKGIILVVGYLVMSSLLTIATLGQALAMIAPSP